MVRRDIRRLTSYVVTQRLSSPCEYRRLRDEGGAEEREDVVAALLQRPRVERIDVQQALPGRAHR